MQGQVEISYCLPKAVTKVQLTEQNQKKFAQNCMRTY